MCCSDANFVLRRTHVKLPKYRNLLKFETNPFCIDDKQGFLNPHTKFKAGFIFEPVSSGRKLQRRTLKSRVWDSGLVFRLIIRVCDSCLGFRI